MAGTIAIKMFVSGGSIGWLDNLLPNSRGEKDSKRATKRRSLQK